MPFAIRNAAEYRRKVEEDLADLLTEIDNSRFAINAVTSAYHLHDWLWSHVLKQCKPAILDGEIIKTKNDFAEWLKNRCPHFTLMRDLTNGSKHAYPIEAKTDKIEGYGVGPYGVGPYGVPYLLIDLGANEGNNRYLVASDMIRAASTYMTQLSKSLGA